MCPGYDCKLPTQSAGTNDLWLQKYRKTTNYLLTHSTKHFGMTDKPIKSFDNQRKKYDAYRIQSCPCQNHSND